MCFLPAPVFALLAPRVQIAEQVALIHRFGPLGLLLFCLINVLLASEDRAITYSPAEVNFLFPGPYRPRQLLLYKIVGTLLAAVFTSLVFTLFLFLGARAHITATSARFLSAFVGVLLSLVFLYLFVDGRPASFISTFGAAGVQPPALGSLARCWSSVLIAAWAAILGSGGRDEAAGLDGRELILRLERSAAVQAALVPFQPFVRAFTAERLWPDLVAWSSLAAALDAAMLGLILVLNAQYLEASATASARRYERLQMARSGGGLSSMAVSHWRLPALPSWGGIGPNLWRQGTTALRSPSRVVTKLATIASILLILPVIMMVDWWGTPGLGGGEAVAGDLRPSGHVLHRRRSRSLVRPRSGSTSAPTSTGWRA